MAEAAWTRLSADLYVAGDVKNSNDTGKSSGVTYAVGAVKGMFISLGMMHVCSDRGFSALAGEIRTATMDFLGYTVENQAYRKQRLLAVTV